MQTPLVPSKLSGVKRCPDFGGFRDISSRCGNAQRYEDAVLELSLAVRWQERITRGQNYAYQLVNQPAVPDNLVQEACQRLHYQVNFVQSKYQRDRKICLLYGIARCPHFGELLSITCNANSIQTATFCPVMSVKGGSLQQFTVLQVYSFGFSVEFCINYKWKQNLLPTNLHFHLWCYEQCCHQQKKCKKHHSCSYTLFSIHWKSKGVLFPCCLLSSSNPKVSVPISG